MPILELPPNPPPGLNYIAAIKPSLNFILIVAPLGSLLVPTVAVLLFFSTPTSRKRPIFILNLCACLLGLADAFLITALMYKQIILPQEPISQVLYRATVALALLTPVVVDSILLIRVLAFYPHISSTKFRRFGVLALPVLIKSGRLICVALFLHQDALDSRIFGSFLLASAEAWPKNPYIIAEWTLQIVDNA